MNGGKNVNAVAVVMIDTGARMLIKLPSEMRPCFFLRSANAQLMRKTLPMRNFSTILPRGRMKVRERCNNCHLLQLLASFITSNQSFSKD